MTAATAVLDQAAQLRSDPEVSAMSILDLLRHSSAFLMAAATATSPETERASAVQAAALAILAVEAIERTSA